MLMLMILMFVDTDVNTHLDVDDDDHPPHKNAQGLFSKTITSAAPEKKRQD